MPNPTIECPVHGTGPTDRHHKLPQVLGGTDTDENLETLCRKCHWEHHRHDYLMKVCGWWGLVKRLRAEGIDPRAYMASLQEDIRCEIGEAAYSERMRKVGRGESPDPV